jgi:hypothetical protein
MTMPLPKPMTTNRLTDFLKKRAERAATPAAAAARGAVRSTQPAAPKGRIPSLLHSLMAGKTAKSSSSSDLQERWAASLQRRKNEKAAATPAAPPTPAPEPTTPE